jgi:hypothetical protein
VIELQRRSAKRLIGRSVRVACLNGTTADGHLVNFDGRSLWLSRNDTDTFVPITHVVALTAAVA